MRILFIFVSLIFFSMNATAAECQYADNTLVSGHNTAFVIKGCARFLINGGEFEFLGYRWDSVKAIGDNVDSIPPAHAPLPQDMRNGALLTDYESKTVFYVESGYRRPFLDPDEFNAMQLDGESIVRIPASEIELVPLGSPMTAPFQGRRTFRIGIGAFLLQYPRSTHEDTVYAAVSLWVNGKPLGTAHWDGAGGREFTNRWLKLDSSTSLSTGDIGPGDIVKVSIIVFSTGHAPSDDEYKKIAAVIGSRPCHGSLSCSAALTGKQVEGLFTANCGPLAAATFEISGVRLNNLSPIKGSSSGMYIPETDGNTFYGEDSPPGCGHNGNYKIDMLVVQE